jgi:hypothetical protein
MINCLCENCCRTPVVRGCCRYHYNIYRRSVHAGEITFEQLEKDGKVLPSRIEEARTVLYNQICKHTYGKLNTFLKRAGRVTTTDIG